MTNGLMHSVRVLRGTDENLKVPGAFLAPPSAQIFWKKWARTFLKP